ncbi:MULTISPECIES: TonB-dependent receptor [Acinetobacter]|uniref:TonB-dependent receptor n=1 Tax=Acinetobacter TaxID=469 RepID=UPI00141B6006|nr:MULTISPECIES: TonB-dependent receptor [Acinetobacter]MCS4298985.1 iron complex outermembrane receptor protein [Acinetobacter guillouiae]MCW2250368.1 iron complex outermembrane receptor protein [Acinetobacter sp. BIGb0204]NII37535.1 iron complex outermembrane receptor protein [Acinetobacter sp. BIGb0196]
MKSNKIFNKKSDVKKIIPLISIGGFIFLSQSSFAISPTEATDTENKAAVLPTITVSASRSDEFSSSAKQVTKLDEKQIEFLKNASSGNIATVLAKVVPGLSDSSRTITDYGQTLRGRNALILVDGVPMNLTRDTSRGLSSIDPQSITGIEVIRGSNAIYGSGAAGGTISITTKAAGGEPTAKTVIGLQSALTNFRTDALSGDIHQYFSGSLNNFDYAFDFGYQRIGSPYDARGDRVAPEPSQGDLFDADTYSVGGKLGYHIDDNQYLQFAANYYNAEQDSDYASDPSVAKLPAGSVPAKAIKGLKLKDQNKNENQIYNLTYNNKDLFGSKVDAQIYYRDFFTRFSPFDARQVSTRGGQVDQVYQNNNVLGSRLTVNTPLEFLGDTSIVWGGDFSREKSEMPLDTFDPKIYDQSGGLEFVKNGKLIYLPELTTQSIGGFAQLKHNFNEQWSAEVGTRYEDSYAKIDSFVPLSQLSKPNPYTVKGGKVTADAWLYNANVTFKPTDQHSIYASFNQGFQLPDVGVVIRNATAGFNLASSFLEPVKVDNYELGWNGHFNNFSSSLAVFQSTSDLGGVQSFNNGLILTRTKEKVTGVEATLDYLDDAKVWGTGGSVTWMKGRETPQNTNKEQDMTGYRIPPLKVTGYISYSPTDTWTNRLQATYFASEDYRLNGVNSFGRYDVKSYTTADLISSFALNKKDTVTIGLENMFNRKYYPLYSQLLRTSNNTSHLLASGATLKVTYSHKW